MASIIDTENLLIGAGPSGLAVAGCLTQAGTPFTIIEAAADVGHSWRNHYDRLHLHTVKEESHLPGLPFPAATPRYPSRQDVVDYLAGYAAHFDIRPRFDCAAAHIDRDGDRWVTRTSDGDSYRARNVVIATGLNRVPRRPDWPGLATTTLPVTHSRDYRNGAQLAGQRVLVVGMGNTGAEIALDLVEHGARPTLAVRGPVNVVRRDSFGLPVQKTALKLQRLPPGIADRVGRVLQRLTVGSLEPWGIQKPAMSPVIQLKTTGQTPVIDIGTVDAIRRGDIAVRPGLRAFHDSEIEFTDGTREAFDHIVLATGYGAELEALVDESRDLQDERGYLAGIAGNGRTRGLYFVGFCVYEAGGILRSIRRDAQLVADSIINGAGRAA
ncbi:MAG: NAD(P)/FAD-dependent oxidoreductase [Gammaproteobacteria bacterium]|nr:NAD(P)/FAD-dependent oxidoreductase [Gammaproteobacteria bacterium]NNM01245.1 NAD(P)/FAD-dependent oxidoreductase [Gammaproteobacteria bacterium]